MIMKKYLAICSMFIFVASCSLLNPTENPKELPMQPIYQYFDEEDGAMKRYTDLLSQALSEGKISQAQFDIYMSEVASILYEVEKIKAIQNGNPIPESSEGEK
jgi:hypothetical protein